MSTPDPTFIYHFTHFSNLRAIIEHGLICKNRVVTVQVDASLGSIQERRKRKIVSSGPGGTLHDYVPFYFAPRSPMMYLISKGEVESYQGTQDELVYLVTCVQDLTNGNVGFVFTDGHPIVFPSQFYENLGDLEKVDWDIIQGKWWFDSPAHPDRQRRRQAEFLVRDSCPWSFVQYIGVRDQEMAKTVEGILSNLPQPLHRPVIVRRHWYY